MNKQYKKGFTLMETLIYMALFGILMTGAITATYQLLTGGSRIETAVAVQEEGNFINRKINWALIGATGVVSGGSTLTITRPDLGAESPLVIFASSTELMLKRGSAEAVPLNTQSLPVNHLAFVVEPGIGGRPPAITVSFVVKDTPFIFKRYLRE